MAAPRPPLVPLIALLLGLVMVPAGLADVAEPWAGGGRWGIAVAGPGDVGYAFGGLDTGCQGQCLEVRDWVEALELEGLVQLNLSLAVPTGLASAVWDPRVTAACPEGCAYVLGGFNLGGPVTAVQRFDPAGALVTVAFSLPEPRVDAPAVWAGDAAYVFGGCTEAPLPCFGGGCTDAILRIDTTTGTVEVRDARLPEPRCGAAAVWDGRPRPAAGCPLGCAYIFGGFGPSGTTDAIEAYDPAGDVVFEVPLALPDPRSGIAATWDGSRALLFGGLRDPALGDLLMFDPGENTLERSHVRLPGLGESAAAFWSTADEPLPACVRGCAYVLGAQPSGPWTRYSPVLPAPPEELEVRATPTANILAWSPSPDSDVKVYRVFRAVGSGPETLLAEVPADRPGFADGLLGPGSLQYGLLLPTTFTYRVTAVNGFGEGPPSASVCTSSFPWATAQALPAQLPFVPRCPP